MQVKQLHRRNPSSLTPEIALTRNLAFFLYGVVQLNLCNSLCYFAMVKVDGVEATTLNLPKINHVPSIKQEQRMCHFFFTAVNDCFVSPFSNLTVVSHRNGVVPCIPVSKKTHCPLQRVHICNKELQVLELLRTRLVTVPLANYYLLPFMDLL